ncbi:MAG TPA: hypothetical protein VKF62_11655, partial [Planctomycetota bacterium]|nr:hypothetical protein [Planctomycetota bacterium]
MLLLLAASWARPAPVPSPPSRPSSDRGEEALLAGAACIDLTPRRPVAMGGYGARFGAAFDAVH